MLLREGLRGSSNGELSSALRCAAVNHVLSRFATRCNPLTFRHNLTNLNHILFASWSQALSVLTEIDPLTPTDVTAAAQMLRYADHQGADSLRKLVQGAFCICSGLLPVLVAVVICPVLSNVEEIAVEPLSR